MRDAKKYDFIIVGGGSAGLVLANRLSKNPEVEVLVLEAGRPDYWWDLFIHMPAALTIPIGNSNYDWKFETEPEPYLNNRKVYHARGKVLGGSSSINGMIFQRGNPMDFQRWSEDPGMEKWDYAHCLPYFKRMENAVDRDSEFRGKGGPLYLEKGKSPNPLFKALITAARKEVQEFTDDVNGYKQEGFTYFDRNIKKGKRWSSARAYYHPVKDRPNLHLMTKCLTTKVILEGTKAIGVEAIHKGRSQKFFGGEVILSGGAFLSPALLQRSGIGPADELKSLGIRPVVDLPGVGSHLQDHLEVYVQYKCKLPISENPSLKWYKKPFIGFQWLFEKGPAATNHFEAGGFACSNNDVKYPNLMFHFLPLAIRYDGSMPVEGHGYQVHIGPMYSNSRGKVKLKSKNPLDYPTVLFNYLSTPEDRQEWVESIQMARKILNSEAMEEFNGGEISPGPSVFSEEEILEWVKKDAETALHPSCTCRLGTRQTDVLEPNSFKVHGVDSLRVVDASSMPYITNGNIYAPIMMMAEKASDLILGNTPLEAIDLEFYRR